MEWVKNAYDHFFDLPPRPTKIDQKWKFVTSVFFVRFGWNLVWGLIMGQKQHRMSLKYLRPFFDLPAQPTKIDQKWKFLTSVFFVRFGWNLARELNMEKTQDRMSLKCLRPFYQPTSPTKQNWPKVKIFNFPVIYPIWMKFGMGANNTINRPRSFNHHEFLIPFRRGP